MSANITEEFDRYVQDVVDTIKRQMASRSYRAANELRNSAMDVLRGQRSGRVYRKPGTREYYTASAPGEPPAVRTGLCRISWQPTTRASEDTFISQIENDVLTDNRKYTLGEILENGTSRMAPRPHHDRILNDAEPKIVKIYSEPYF